MKVIVHAARGEAPTEKMSAGKKNKKLVLGSCDHNWPLPWDRGKKRQERSIREESKKEQELASLKRKEQMLCQSAADRQRSETCAERDTGCGRGQSLQLEARPYGRNSEGNIHIPCLKNLSERKNKWYWKRVYQN